MGTGKLERRKLIRIIDQVKDLPGDYAEIGVHVGANFKNLVGLALASDKKAWAFDSFMGMNELTENDNKHYPKGKFNVGGVNNFIKLIPAVHNKEYCTRAGYIPDCFEGVDEIFSFIYLDVDTYTPTAEALPWCWEHLITNGYILFDDYFKEGNWGGASEAVDNFLKTVNHHTRDYDNNQLLVQKL